MWHFRYLASTTKRQHQPHITTIMAATSEIRREGSPIAIVRDRQDISSSEDDIRLDDYLNDKLQTAADFEDLDSLIASVEEQRSQLQSQVCLLLFIVYLHS